MVDDVPLNLGLIPGPQRLVALLRTPLGIKDICICRAVGDYQIRLYRVFRKL